MRKIEAVIRPFKVDAVKDAVTALGVGGMTLSEVRGIGRQLAEATRYAGAEYTIDLLPKSKIEIVVAEHLLDSVVSAICKAAWTGAPGDGKIFVCPIIAAIRIRTNETGETAL